MHIHNIKFFLYKHSTIALRYDIIKAIFADQKTGGKLEMDEQGKIFEVAKLLKESVSLMFITGAGISADSGLPTYRGLGGLYNNKTTEEGMSIETALSGDILSSNPEITWKYIYQIEERCREACFNRGHEVIAEMEKHFERVCVLTQNVDGFHQAAGSQNVIDIHGDIHQLYCPDCSWEMQVNNFSTLSIPPECPECQTVVRPDVVFFGEMLPEAKLKCLLSELERGFDLYFSIGTTSVFPYIMQPMLFASHKGKPTIEINPGQTEISHIVDFKINQGAAKTLDELWELYLKLKDSG